MTIGVIATLTVKEGCQADFEATFADLAQQVLANEEGTLLYALHRSQSDSCVYKVMEQYRAQADLVAHGKTDYFKQANVALAPFMAAPPDIEVLDLV